MCNKKYGNVFKNFTWLIHLQPQAQINTLPTLASSGKCSHLHPLLYSLLAHVSRPLGVVIVAEIVIAVVSHSGLVISGRSLLLLFLLASLAALLLALRQRCSGRLQILLGRVLGGDKIYFLTRIPEFVRLFRGKPNPYLDWKNNVREDHEHYN